MTLGVTCSPPDLASVCMIHIPAAGNQHSHHHKSNPDLAPLCLGHHHHSHCQEATVVCAQILHFCVLDPYSDNKVTTRWEGSQSLSYHKQSSGKNGLLFANSCLMGDGIISAATFFCVLDPYTAFKPSSESLPKCRELAPRSVTSVCWTPVQHSHHHNIHCQKLSVVCTQICHLCVLDPYSITVNTHTIITVTNHTTP